MINIEEVSMFFKVDGLLNAGGILLAVQLAQLSSLRPESLLFLLAGGGQENVLLRAQQSQNVLWVKILWKGHNWNISDSDGDIGSDGESDIDSDGDSDSDGEHQGNVLTPGQCPDCRRGP